MMSVFAKRARITPISNRAYYDSVRDTPEWVAVNEFGSTYYSGLDVSVYFDDIFIDEIVSITFSEMEQVRPLIGYSSYTPNAFIHGSRYVQGSFTINFKDAGYIYKMLSYITSGKADRLIGAESRKELSGETAATVRSNTASKVYTAPANLDSAIKLDYTLEDIINMSASGDVNGYRRSMDTFTEKYWSTPGVESDPLANSPKYDPGTDDGFDIVIKYGQPEDYYRDTSGKPMQGWGTVQIIKGCHIQNCQKTIDDSGRNILEAYEFIAKTIV